MVLLLPGLLIEPEQTADSLSMNLQNSMVRVIPEKNTDKIWFCSSCGHHNAVQARFCGGCGRTTMQAAQEADVVVDRKPEMNRPSDSLTFKEAAEEIMQGFLRIVSAASKAFLCLASSLPLQKVALKRPSRLVLSFCLATAVAAGVWVSRSPGHQESGFVKWEKFRSYVSQKLIIAPHELDGIFSSINALPVCDDAQITPNQVVQLEKALKSRFADNELSLFPNPFYGTVGTRPGDTVFVDVALDHPVYTALKALLELGIPVADQNFKIRPYEKIRWAEWHETVGALAELLGIAKENAVVSAAEFMTNQDLRFSLASLRRRFFLGGVDKLSSYSPKSFASRFEAYSALSSIVEELNRSR